MTINTRFHVYMIYLLFSSSAQERNEKGLLGGPIRGCHASQGDAAQPEEGALQPATRQGCKNVPACSRPSKHQLDSRARVGLR